MQTYEIKMKVPRELLMNLKKPLEDVEKDIREQAAIRYYKKRILSLGKSSALAGLTRFEFIDLLRYNGEPIFHYSADELAEINKDSDQLEKILNGI
jgi:predicted HTH domain antitoxin